jgi:hypothetical protein
MTSLLLSGAAMIEAPSCTCPVGNTSIFTCNEELVTACVSTAVDGHFCNVAPPTIGVFQYTNEISRVHEIGRLHMLHESLVLDKARHGIRISIAIFAAVFQPTVAAAPSAMAAMIQAPSLAANV